MDKTNVPNIETIIDYNGQVEFGFDDGFAFDLVIAEMLEKYGLRGTFYIVVDWVDKEGFLTWEQIKDLYKRGHKIGSHTVTHPQDLKVLYEQDLHYEIQNSKDMIEIVVGENISRFCYPRGRYDDRVKSFVAQAGYVFARVTGKIGNTEIKDNLSLPGTIHIAPRKEYGDRDLVALAKEKIDLVRSTGKGYCNIWGHGKEINDNQLWSKLEEIIKYAAQK